MATKVLFNTVVNWFIRQRIDQIQNFMNHPVETQNGVLFSQLYFAENTDYGKIHGFNSVSYTHLDVYKRQVMGIASKAFAGKSDGKSISEMAKILLS